MADAPFIGEMRIFSGPIPNGWAACDGTMLQISTNQPLFSLIGTTYGGNGSTTFALPDMRGKVGVGFQNGTAYPLGATGGAASVTLTLNQMPSHTHQVFCSSTPGSNPSPAGGIWGPELNNSLYSPDQGGTMSENAITPSGSNQAHNNMQPFLSLTWAICLQGIFPTRD